MEDFGVVDDEHITMRNINSTLKKMGDRELRSEDERDASSDILQRGASRANNAIGAVNMDGISERDYELETCGNLSRRKRKHDSDNAQRVSCECAPSNQPSPSEQGVHNMGIRENSHIPTKDLQACSFPEATRSHKRRRESSKVHEVGLDISLRTDGSHRLQGLGFDISVSSSVAVGIKHATCSIIPDKDSEKATGARLAVDVVNNQGAADCKRGEKVAGYCEVPRAMTVQASEIPNKDVCSMSTTVTSGKRTLEDLVRVISAAEKNNCRKTDDPVSNLRKTSPRPEKSCSEYQADSQKLQVAVAALYSQLEFLQNLAEKGCKDCKQCKAIKEGFSNLFNSCESFAQKFPSTAAVSQKRSSSEEASMCNSPVGSCTIERAIEKEDHGRHSQDAVDLGNLNSGLPSEMFMQTQNKGMASLLDNTKMNEGLQEGSDSECHLCIELASSQSDDLDTDPAHDRSDREEHNVTASLNSVPCKSTGPQICPEGTQNGSCDSRRYEEVNSDLGKDITNYLGIETNDKGEESSAKSSKEEGCWNSAITRDRDSADLYAGRIDDEAERDGYIDLRCGCTSQKYGDTHGILRLYQNGKLEIQCQCCIGCIKGKPMSPANFEKHSGRGASKKWRDSIWIVLGDQKVQFSKVKGLDAFVRRYKETSRSIMRQTALPKQSAHRDEFLQCKKCLKRRRFLQKTKEECRLFHDASMNPEWECSDHPNESFHSCQDDEEREARQAYRGCSKSRSCPGCIECVCVGCFTCRFEDCECRLCTEFMANNK